MLNLKNTLDGYLKNVEVIGNTIQDANNLADIRSVGDKVEGQELYKIDVVSCGKNLVDGSKHYLVDMKHETQRYATINSGRHTSSDAICYLKPGTYKFSIKDFDMSKAVDSALYVWKKDKNYSNARRYSIKDAFTITEDDIGITFYLATSTVEDTQAIFNKPFMIEEGTQVTPYEPYKEQKLEILSPVQLEKVGNVADRIVCKDGVWGIEKNIATRVFDGSGNWVKENADLTNTVLFGLADALDILLTTSNHELGYLISNQFMTIQASSQGSWGTDKEGISLNTGGRLHIRILKSKLSSYTKGTDFKNWLISNNVLVKYVTTQPQFIPLPQDQQIKLRTFAGQTNITFLTEIPGQIKAQVPKSLGAVVNTHTQQIEMLHNALKSVLAGDMYSLATILYPEDFEQNDNTEQDIMVIPE